MGKERIRERKDSLEAKATVPIRSGILTIRLRRLLLSCNLNGLDAVHEKSGGYEALRPYT